MKDKDQAADDLRVLRERAEQMLTPNGKRDIAKMTPEDIAAALHDLATHQIELELQNEELRRTYGQLTEARDQYAELYDGAPVGYITTNAQGLILQTNRTFAEMLGIPGASLVNEPLSACIFPQDQEVYYKHRRSAVATRKRENCELHLKTKDGALFWVRVDSQCEGTPDPTQENIRSVITNITKRKQAEFDKERLTTAIEQLAEIIVITDPEGTIQYVNEAFETITGYSREEVIGQNPRVLKSEEHSKAFYQEMWATLVRGETWTGQVVNRKKDGRLYTEETTISPVKDSTGTIVNYVAIKADITAALALEAQLRQSQKMESIGRLAGGIAHDFNNILQAITGFSEMLMMHMDGCIAGRPTSCVAQRADVEGIHKAALHAADLTRQLLTFSRKQSTEHRMIELNAVLADEIRLLERVIEERIDLQFDPCPEPLPISANASQIVQIVMNLVANARDAMPECGTVRVATQGLRITEDEAREIAHSRAGEFACLSVSDDGEGMNAEQLTHLFEPFYTSKEVGKGTGLGLSMIYGIVQDHGGWIDVSSAIDAGTTIRVYLPIQRGQD